MTPNTWAMYVFAKKDLQPHAGWLNKAPHVIFVHDRAEALWWFTLLAAIAGTIALAGLLFAVLDIADRCVQSAPLAEDQAAPGNADGNGDGA